MAEDIFALPAPPPTPTPQDAPPLNPYDAVVVDLDRARGQQARANIMAGGNPDTTAKALPIAKALNVPVDTVERNLPDFEGIKRSNEYDALLKASPTLARWMSEPVNARLTGADLPKLAAMEGFWGGLTDAPRAVADLGRSVAAGVLTPFGTGLSGLGALYNVATNTLDEGLVKAGIKSAVTPNNLPSFLDPAKAFLSGPGAAIKTVTEAIDVPPERRSLGTDVVKGVGQIGGQIAAIIATGGTASFALMIGQGADAMAEVVAKEGKTNTLGGNVATVAGAAVLGVLEKTGMDILLNRVPPAIKNKVLRVGADLFIAGGIEAAQEGLEQIAQNALSNYHLGTKKDLTEGVVEAATPAGLSAALVRAMLGVRGRGRPDTGQPETDAASLDKIMASVKGTDLAGRSPEKMAEFLGTLPGGDRNVYVPVEAVREYFQRLEPQAAADLAATLGITGQLEQALATGGDVVIALNQYMAHAPEDMATGWREEIRLRASGMSVREAKEYEVGDGERAKALGETITKRAEETTRQDRARDEVAAIMERQFQNAGQSPEEARNNAALYGERYVTRAARSGIAGDDAANALARSGVEVRSDLPEAIKQAPADDLELLIRALKGRTDRSEAKGGKGASILQYIAGAGGIIDDGGELRARDLDKWHVGKPFQRRVTRDAPPSGGFVKGEGDRSRYGADAWTLRLWEAGYFPEFSERPTPDDLYAAIDAELRGKPRYLPEQQRDWRDDFQTAVMDLDELLTRAGVDARKASVEEVRAAIEGMKAGEGQAYEQPVYHGSPHIFDRFSLDKIGAGEGVQAYGWGLYFAGKKQVSEYYRDALTRDKPGQVLLRGEPIERVPGKTAYLPVHLRTILDSIERGTAFSEAKARSLSDLGFRKAGEVKKGNAEEVAEIDTAISAIVLLKDGDLTREKPGRLYHVEIPDDGAYLLWDKPLSEQPEAVRKALASVPAEMIALRDPVTGEPAPQYGEPLGREIYEKLAVAKVLPEDQRAGFDARSPQEASRYLASIGIPGIKYLDGSSRSRGDGSFNYVLFDDSLVSISKYEQAPDGSTPRGNIVFSQDAAGQTRSLITLFKDRNLSTALHETVHLWVEELHADGSRPNAPQQLKDDLKIMRDFAGAKGNDPLTVEQHEKLARAGEAYLMEGKSPSVALSPVLARFKAWLISVYKTVKALRVEITPEIRGVFDRLIATDEAIEEARTEVGARQLFASADQAGWTDAEFKAYTDAVTRSQDRAEQEVLGKLMDQVRAARTAEWKEESDAIRDEVRGMVASQPDLVAYGYLRNGDLPESLAHLREMPRLRLSRDELIDEYGNPEVVNALPKAVPPLVVQDGGVGPGEIAELLGFPDGRAMIDALTVLAKEQAGLKAAGDKRSVRVSRIDAEVDRMMKERHGDMLTDGSIEAEALSALHNEAWADVLAAEHRGLARMTGKPATPYQLIKTWAKRAIAEKAVEETFDLSQYTRAEAKAARLAEAALIKGDADEALRRKQEQMIAHALWMEARDAKEEIEKGRKVMDRYAGARTIRSMDQDYLEKIHALLERFDLKTRSLRSVERSESLRQWAEKQQALGIDVAVPEKLLDEAYRTSYRRMTVEEFRGLNDSVKQLAHLGRKKQKYLDGKDKREFDAVVEEGVALAGMGRQSGDTTTNAGKTNFQRKFGDAVSLLRSGDAALLKIEYLFKWLDGNKATGVFGRLFERMSGAQADERTQWQDLGGKLHALFHEIPVESRKRMQDVSVYPELNGVSLRRDALMSVALNMGNDGNRTKMLKGHGWTEEGVLAAIDRGLEADEMAFVQKTWDLIETLWPQIADLERRVNGVEPEKVERVKLTTRHGTFEGGYFPLVYEPKRQAEQGDRPGALAAGMESETYVRATTPKGFTKERVENFARPIHLSLEVIPQHLMEVVHDIHWREPIMEGQRFLSDARIKNAIREKLGPEYEQQMQPWLNHMALEYVKDRQGMAGWDSFMKGLRGRVTMVGMGYRLTTVLAQVGGYADSTAEIGVRWMASGTRTYAAHPIDSIAFVRSRSGEMQHRAYNLDRDIRQVSRELEGKDGLLDPVRNFAFHGIAWADAAVTIPTWLGAYNKAQHEGQAEAEAIEYADKMVRLSQGAAGGKDLVRLQRSGEAGKLVTMFYSYFSHYYNAQRDVGRRLVDATVEGDPRAFGAALARAFWLNGPGVLAAQLLAGQGPEDDETWGAWVARTSFFNLFMGIPVARDLASGVSNAIAGKFVGGYQLSPAGRALETGGKFVFSDIPRMVQGDEATRAVSHGISALGYAANIPTGQLATTTQFLYDALWSKTANPQDVSDWIRGSIYGPPAKK